MKQLTFKTIPAVEDGQKTTLCYPSKSGSWLKHPSDIERTGHGHDPGVVYLLRLPNKLYKIGKCEVTKTPDTFELDTIHYALLKRLHERMIDHHKEKKEEKKILRDAVFLHAILVPCGEGGEQQVHKFFSDSEVKTVGVQEIFELDEDDIAVFKNAEGEMLERDIKHLPAEEFEAYLKKVGENRIRIASQ